MISSVERRDIHKVINQLDAEERMIIYSIYFEKTCSTAGRDYMSQVLAYKLWKHHTQDAENVSGKYF